MDYKKNWFYLAVACVVLSAWYFRFDVTPVMHGEQIGGVYKINRITGETMFLRGYTYAPVEDGR